MRWFRRNSLWMLMMGSTSAMALPQTDKAAHFGLSAVGTEAIMKVCQVAEDSHTIPLWCRIGASVTMFAIGVGKEISDKNSGGKFDRGDLSADALGVITGNLLQLKMVFASLGLAHFPDF